MHKSLGSLASQPRTTSVNNEAMTFMKSPFYMNLGCKGGSISARLFNYSPILSHSRLEHYFFSYLPTCEVYLIEVLEIIAQILQYIIFLSLKAVKVSLDFILNYLEKVVGGAIWICPQGSQGCQKMRQDPLNMPFEVWCANIAPERHKL